MTFNELIAQVKLDFAKVSDAEVLADLQAIHDELCFDFKLIKSTETETSLVAGTREYALPAGTARVYQVRYVRSATAGDFRVLQETSEDELDQTRRNWRGLDNGEPYKFFADGGNLSLVPAPDTASSGSPAYPRLEFEIASYEPGLDGTEDLPTGLSSYEAWVDGAKMRLALKRQDKRYPLYERAYMMNRRRLATQVNQLPARYQQVYRPAPYQGSQKV